MSLTCAIFDLSYLKYILGNYSKFLCQSCGKFPEFFKTPPTFAIWMSRSQKNIKNKVDPDFWDTLYVDITWIGYYMLHLRGHIVEVEAGGGASVLCQYRRGCPGLDETAT